MKHALRIAVKVQLLSRTPFEDLEQKDWPPKGEERTRHLVGDEWPRLIAEVPQIMKPAVTLLVNTGIRRGELMGIKRIDLNLDAGIAYIGKTKNGKPRWFRLSPQLVEMLKELPAKEGDPRIFWMFTANALTLAVSRAIKRAGLEDFRLHDLRHTFATEVRKRGHGLDVLQKLLGHSDPRMAQRYAHIGDELLNEAASSIDGVFPMQQQDDPDARR